MKIKTIIDKVCAVCKTNDQNCFSKYNNKIANYDICGFCFGRTMGVIK